jgi:hypothetical protein
VRTWGGSCRGQSCRSVAVEPAPPGRVLAAGPELEVPPALLLQQYQRREEAPLLLAQEAGEPGGRGGEEAPACSSSIKTSLSFASLWHPLPPYCPPRPGSGRSARSGRRSSATARPSRTAGRRAVRPRLETGTEHSSTWPAGRYLVTVTTADTVTVVTGKLV